MIRNLIKIHGGKCRIRKHLYKILPNMSSIDLLFEGFVGGGSFFLGLEKLPSKIIINDLDKDLICLYNTVKNDCLKISIDLKFIQYKKEVFEAYLRYKPLNEYGSALRRFVISRMSRGGLCKTFGKSSRNRGGQDEYKNAWETSIKSLPDISDTLQNAEILNNDAINLLIYRKDILDNPNTLIYLDPPYLLSTRKSKKCYENEMSDIDHEVLLKTITRYSSAKIMISGYDSALYENELMQDFRYYPNWNKCHIEVANNSGQSKTKQKRIETVWRNYWT